MVKMVMKNSQLKTLPELHTGRARNFGAGPAMLPTDVMLQAQAELTDWNGTGMSVMEISHRSKAFIAIAEQTEADLRELLQIPENYRVLFLQGGATSQFAMVPLNLLRGNPSADYLFTGMWSEKAIKEAKRYCRVNIALSLENNGFTSIPSPDSWRLDSGAAYVYYTDNETVHGVEFQSVPGTGGVPLVTDMTSNILSKPLDVSQFGVIFAGAQKNLGPSGLVVVIVRDDLIGHAPKNIPSMYDYAVHAQEHSMFNTPPTFAWYMTGLVLRWVKCQGGVPEMERRAIRRSEKLYRFIDASGFYHNPVSVECRSRMNIPFILADENLNQTFVQEAEAHGLTALAGHRAVGGMRASIYNAMPEEGVDELIEFMADFERRYG
jgi:phosphoserine aminotransferase